MEENPYQALAALMRPTGPADGLLLCEGRVQSIAPLTVSAFGLLWSGNDVKVNAQLLGGWSQEVSIISGTDSISGKEEIQSGILRSGDQVLCLSNGGETLYVLMKVV